jgi:hypothetical protein
VNSQLGDINYTSSSISEYSKFKYLNIISRAAHKHRDFNKMISDRRVFRAQAYAVRNEGNHTMFPITNNTFLTMLLAHFSIACWNGGKLTQGFVRRVLEKRDERTRCERERWRELVQDRVQLWVFGFVVPDPWFSGITRFFSSVAACLPFPSFTFFLCRASFIPFYSLLIFDCFLFLVIIRISTRINQKHA